MKKQWLHFAALTLFISGAFTLVPYKDPFFQRLEQRWKAYWAAASPEKVYLHLERTIFQPGEDVWFKAYLRDAFTHLPAEQSHFVHVQLLDPKGKVIQQKKLAAFYGSAPGDFELPANSVGGIYKIQAYTRWMKNENSLFEREISVNKASLPRLKMQLEFERKAFGPGDEVVARLDLFDLQNQALANYPFEHQVYLSGMPQPIAQGKTDAEGRCYIRFRLPNALQSNDGLLAVQLEYNEFNESISRAIPIQLNQIDLQFLPEGGYALAGVVHKMAFKAINEFGKPADVAGIVYNENGAEVARFSSFHQGMGSFELNMEAGHQYLARLTQPAQNAQEFLLPKAQEEGLSLSLMAQDDRQIAFKIQARGYDGPIFLSGISAGSVLLEQKITLTAGTATVKISTKDWPMGIATFTLFDENKQPRCERLAMLHPDKKLNIDIKTNKEKYLPREEVQLDVQVTDADGQPVVGNFSLAVTDDNLLTFADDKQGHLLAYMLLESELKGKVEEPNFYFDPKEPKARQALDYLMLTQGWRKWSWPEILTTNSPDMLLVDNSEKANIGGQVLNKNREPIAEATVVLLPQNLFAVTDENGFFQFEKVVLDVVSDLDIESEAYAGTFSIRNYGKQQYLLSRKAYQLVIEPDRQVSIRGEALDAESGTPLPFANVLLWKNEKFVQGIEADWDGSFEFKNLDSGTYELEFRLMGYSTNWVKNIWLPTGKKARLSAWMKKGITLETITVTEYKVPLIEQDNTTTGAVLTSEQIRNLPTRNINALMATTAGLPSENEGQPVIIRGARTGATDYYIDGIRIKGNQNDDELDAEPPRSAEPPPPPPMAEIIPEDREVIFLDQAMDENAVVVVKKEDVVERAGNITPPPPPPPPPAPAIEEIFKIVEDMPRFPGCENVPSKEEELACSNRKMLEFLYQNLRYPALARDVCIEGTTVVQFVVDKNGQVSNAHIVRDIGGGCGQEALRVIELMEEADIRWIPGKQRGRPVNVLYNVPIKFRLEGGLPNDLQGYEVIPYTGNNTEKIRQKLKLHDQSRSFYSPEFEALESGAQPVKDYRSCLYWNPQVLTDESGKASLRLYTTDAVSAFRVVVEGFGLDGNMGEGVHRFYTQSLFSLDARLPSSLLTQDTLLLPISLSNHSQQQLCGKLDWQLPEQVILLKEVQQDICLEAGGTQKILLPLLLTQKGEHNQLRLLFTTAEGTETWEGKFDVRPRGYPIENHYSGLALQQDFTIEIKAPIDGSIEATLDVYASSLDELINGVESMIRQPSGCFEQVSSSNYPNLLVLDLLEQSGKNNPEIEKKAKAYLANAYKKLVGYESPSGGFHWFGKDPGHEALTAYGIMEFVDMRRVFPVDEKMIARTAQWLLNKRDGKGSWQNGSSALHSWQGGEGVRDAYIVWALSEAGFGKEIKAELERVYQTALKSRDPYCLGLLANALIAQEDIRSNDVLDILAEMQRSDGSWEGKTASIVCSTGKTLEIETTALAALAFTRSKRQPQSVQQAIKFIHSCRNAYGFGHTQSTVLALKALTEYARVYNKTQEDGTIVVYVNGKEVNRKAYEANQEGRIQIAGLGAFLTEEKQQIRVQFEKTKQPLPIDLSVQYTTTAPPSNENCPLSLQTALLQNTAATGGYLRLECRLQNNTTGDLPTPMLEVGIPAGLSPQLWQLKKLGEEGVFDYYEWLDGSLVFYFEKMTGSAEKSIGLDLRANMPGHFESPASCAYLYYQNEVRSWDSPGRVAVLE
ncbi:MAG TPA: carboxypeptidase regulatory-like domain-containing protein [Saprospiraceae bacterium]|nr:carboxypeptidase regulatory-like domain-containing protein [Saprospiraceae bacterium]HMQ81528.1 carboxypeptidase regulatory-like domain-containing protein [Saprospiraceae bacterium]